MHDGFKGKDLRGLAPVYRGGGVLSGTLKGSPQSPAGVPGSSCHCTVWEQGTLTPPLSVGKNTSLRMGEQDLVGNSQIQGWEEELISPRPFVFREGAVPRCSNAVWGFR